MGLTLVDNDHHQEADDRCFCRISRGSRKWQQLQERTGKNQEINVRVMEKIRENNFFASIFPTLSFEKKDKNPVKSEVSNKLLLMKSFVCFCICPNVSQCRTCMIVCFLSPSFIFSRIINERYCDLTLESSCKSVNANLSQKSKNDEIENASQTYLDVSYCCP